MANPTAEFRYHIELRDEHGNELCLNNLERQEVSDFNADRAHDDTDYKVVHAKRRPHNVTSRRVA